LVNRVQKGVQNIIMST